MRDRLAVWPQYLVPQQALTRFAGVVARWQGGAASGALIRWFIRRYNVRMAEAAEPRPEAYASFNDFFTRALRPGARPLATAYLLSPVDGAISQFGRIQRGQIFQAKGHQYSAAALLGGDAVGDPKSANALAAPFEDGRFATLYLSPRDYHRIHMPCAGTLRRMVHVPGALFSVNPTTARGVPGLFARNERVVCLFDDAQGQPFALVLVGATIVGSMATVWHGVVNPPRPGVLRDWRYGGADGAAPVTLAQGAEMGRFLLGSTVVMLFPKPATGAWAFNPGWAAGGLIRMGEMMGESTGKSTGESTGESAGDSTGDSTADKIVGPH